MAVTNQTVLHNGLQLGATVAVNQILNESDLSSNSAEALPTQASVKAYVDATAAGNTLNAAYDQGGAGAGRTVTVDSGAVAFTVPIGSGNAGLDVTQNDTTNNPSALIVTNAGSGAAIKLVGDGTRKISSSSAALSIETVTSGNINLNAAGVISHGAYDYFMDGGEATPSITFTNDPDTGMYRVGTNVIGFACLGAAQLKITSSAINVTDNYITTDTSTDLELRPGTGGITKIGNGTPGRLSTPTNNDLYVTGRVEIDGVLSTESDIVAYENITLLDNKYMSFGGSPNIYLKYSTAQDNHSFLTALHSDSYTWIITTTANVNKNHHPGILTNPTLKIYSATDVDSDATEWFALQHNGSNSVFFSGKGGIQFQQQADIASGNVFSFDTLGIAEITASSGTQSFLRIVPEVAQTLTAGYTALEVDVTETTTGSGSKYLADFQVASSSKFSVYNDGVVYIAQSSAPGTTTDKLYNVSGNLYWNGTQIDSHTGPAGSAPRLQYNTGSGFGATTNVRYDNTNSSLIVGAQDSILWTGAPSLFCVGDSNHGYLAITCSSATSTHYPILVMSRSNGTASSPTATVNDDVVGRFLIGGLTASGWSNRVTGGEIRFTAAENYTTNPSTDYELYMVQAGSSTLARRYKIDGVAGDHYWYGSGASPAQIMVLDGSGNGEGCLTLNTDGGQSYNGLFIYTASSTAGNRANITLSRSRGTNASPTAISDGDIIGEVSIDGCHEADNYVTAGYIRSTAAGNWSSSSFPADLSFFTNAGSAGYTTPIMSLTNEGRVGIKETAPLYGVHITANDDRAGGSIMMETYTGTGAGGPILAFRSARGTLGSATAVQSGHNLAYIAGTGYNGTDYKTGGVILMSASETWDGTGNGSQMYFYTVANSTTSTVWRLHIDHDGAITMPAVYSDTVTSSRDLEIDSSGKLGYVSSATRYKENIQAYSDASWLHDLPVKTFTYISDSPAGDTHYGFLAEDLEGLNSDLVFYEDGQIEGIHYKRMIPITVRALQQLKVEADGYGGRLDSLDARYIPAAGGGHAWYNTAETPAKVLEVSDAGSLYAFQTYNDTVVNGRDLMIQSDGKIGYESSAKRYKKYIKSIDSARWLGDLRPVTFKNRKDNTNELQYGLIAEEVEEVNSDFVFYDKDYKIEGVHYKKFIPVLIKAQQEQRKEAKSLEETVADLEQKIVDLQKKLSKLSGKDKTGPKL